jgi:hypothetical protein
MEEGETAMSRPASAQLTIALIGATLAVVLLATPPAPAAAADAALATLADRAAIEDLLVGYYSGLGTGKSDYSAYYLPEGVLNVDGLTASGAQGIADLYKKAGATLPHGGTFRMLLTNLRVNVSGESATADAIWTGVYSETVNSAPQIIEQGREHDELVKRSGRWLFKLRLITTDGGRRAMPAVLDGQR